MTPDVARRLPRQITSVPTLVIMRPQRRMITGKAVFDWLLMPGSGRLVTSEGDVVVAWPPGIDGALEGQAVLALALTFLRSRMKESERWEEATNEGAKLPGWSAVLTPKHLASILYLVTMYGMWNLWAGYNGFFTPYLIEQNHLPGIIDVTPGIRSLQIHFDPHVQSAARLLDASDAPRLVANRLHGHGHRLVDVDRAVEVGV